MNPALRQLGYGPQDRVVVIHADDVGMCQATLPAITELMEFGLVSSASVMVPCPWFPAVAAYCRDNPTVDMGVHLTMNCEWESYRWGPVSTSEPESGLIDGQGYFHASPVATVQAADPTAVAAEVQAQLHRALRAGIDVTHVDSHMGTNLHPNFIESYIQVALDNRLPMFVVHRYEERLLARDVDSELAADGGRVMRELEARGVPLFDEFEMMPLDDSADQVARARQIIDELRPGLTAMIVHPAVDTPELRAIAPDWRSRVANYEVCLSHELREHVRQSGVQVIGYRPLRDLMQASS